MTEFELKLEVPAERREHVALAFGKAPRKRLQAKYFDTAGRALARSKIVVRIRKEGSRWVQTAKASSSNALERLEHNVELPRQTAETSPAIDLQRHTGTPLEARLRHALNLREGEPFPALALVFETDVYRQLKNVKVGRGMVEVAFDRGRVSAGERHAGLCEVEFELKAGRPQDAVRTAAAWCAKHGLWLSSVSKSLKGQRLAEGTEASATAGQPLRLDGRASLREAMGAMVLSCMDHVLPNASEIAAGSTDREQIHQLRVGLRRLRGVLRELGGPGHAIDATWEPELAQVFRILGEHRDQQFLAEKQQPQLQAAGGPALDTSLRAPVLADPVAAVRSSAFQRTLLDLLAFAHGRVALVPERDGSAKAAVRARLKKLHRSLVKGGRGFLSFEEEGQHKVRKRLKRLRYLSELGAPFFSGKKVDRFLRGLKPVQDSLGTYNDELMALDGYRKLAQVDPRAWFGVGWLSATRQSNAAACQKDLEALGKLKIFW